MKTLIWLDDYRDPMEGQWLTFSPITLEDIEVHWLKSYDEFVEWITKNGLPDAVCYDHDLADVHYQPPEFYDESHPDFKKIDYNQWAAQQSFKEKTGYDCAKWIVEYCMDNNKKLPLYNIQSANPVGKANIDGLFKSFIKNQLR